MAESSGRTRQENMMADYSDWAWDSDGGSAAAKALLVFSSMVATIGIVVLRPQRLGVDLPFERGFWLVFIELCALVISLRYIVFQRGTSFTECTEEVFGITHLTFDGQQGGDYRLPADGTQASWLRGDRSESGRFTIEGDKVGLCVRSDGTLLKPVKR